MNQTQTNPGQPVLTIWGGYDYSSGKPIAKPNINVYAGESRPLADVAKTGLTVRVGGQEATIFRKTRAFAHMRSVDQEILKVPLDTHVEVVRLGQYDAGLPKRGEFVQDRQTGEVGVVATPGLLSTYVAFPGVENLTKYHAANLRIVKARIEVLLRG